jgi:hypothetical protein
MISDTPYLIQLDSTSPLLELLKNTTTSPRLLQSVKLLSQSQLSKYKTKTPSKLMSRCGCIVSETPLRNNNTPSYRFFSKLAVPVIKCLRLNGEDFCVPTETSRKQAMEQEGLASGKCECTHACGNKFTLALAPTEQFAQNKLHGFGYRLFHGVVV